MQEKAAPDAPPARKRKRETSDVATAPGSICDDVYYNIFARLPARTAVASMVLSKHHNRLICSQEFRSLHCRLSPPLPSPHIAYVATAPIRRRRSERDPVGAFHGFHVAGAGLSRSDNAPMRALAGRRYLEMKYVNTCNGVVLLAPDTNAKVATCVLCNPAVADEVKEVTVPACTLKRVDYRRRGGYDEDSDDCYCVLGLGYGPRSKAYKIILSLRRRLAEMLMSKPPKRTYSKELLVYSLGAAEEPRLVTLLSSGMDSNISRESLYINGTIYLLAFNRWKILAFDVDNETVTDIRMPGSSMYPVENRVTSELMQMSGRPCLVKNDDHHRALWLLMVDHRWERRFVFKVENNLRHCPIKGIWDCDGVLVMYLYNTTGGDHKILFYQVATKKILKGNLPRDMTPEESDYGLCWGYRPTLVSPGSIVGELGQDVEQRRECTVDIIDALKPVNEQDKRKGQKATLDTVCFMEFLIRIMLPDSMQDVIEMPLLISEDPDSRSQDEVNSD